MEKAAAIVAMGGYNTFCEILSFDKRALIVPRTQPAARAVHPRRRGRAARARAHAERLDAAARLAGADGGAPCALPHQPRPSDVTIPGLLDGLDRVRSALRRCSRPKPRASRPIHQAAE